MVLLYTIGFTGKSAEQFFYLLKNSGVRKIIDIRLHNTSQLSGFAKESDLKFFLKEITNITYEHNLDYAPTRALLSRYRNNRITWLEYENEYQALLKSRNVAGKTDIGNLHNCCLLCSEHSPQKCHRRLLAEYFGRIRNDINVVHLLD